MDSLMSTIVGIAGVLDTDRKVNEMNSDIHEAERVREALHAKIRLVDSAGRECMDKTFEARRLNDSAMLEYYQKKADEYDSKLIDLNKAIRKADMTLGVLRKRKVTMIELMDDTDEDETHKGGGVKNSKQRRKKATIEIDDDSDSELDSD